MRVHALIPIAAILASACGDGRHIDGLDRDDGRGHEAQGLVLEHSWSNGLTLEVDDLRWANEGEIEFRIGFSESLTGQSVYGIDARHFRFTEDGVDLGREVLFDVRREHDLRVVLVLDLSRSTQEAYALEPLKSGSRALVEALPRGAKVAIVRFATSFEAVTEFTADGATLLESIDALAPADGRDGQFTNLWGALEYSAELFDESTDEGEERVVVVFTDGRDNVAEGDFATARSALSEAGAVVYGVGLGEEVDAIALTELSGAARYSATAEPTALTQIFADIGARIGELLRVTYVTPKVDGTHTLSVTVERDDRAGGFDLLFTPR